MGKLVLDTSILSFYRRSLKPADALISDAGTNPAPALDLKAINLVEGDWVSLNDAGEAVAITSVKRLAYPVWVGGRTDSAAAGKITVIAGPHSGKTSRFDATPTGGGAYAAGELLTVRNGVLDRCASGEPINAICEGEVTDVSTDFPDGFLPYTTVNSGGYAP